MNGLLIRRDSEHQEKGAFRLLTDEEMYILGSDDMNMAPVSELIRQLAECQYWERIGIPGPWEMYGDEEVWVREEPNLSNINTIASNLYGTPAHGHPVGGTVILLPRGHIK